MSLYDYYANTFETVRADTPELLHECFYLRYNVYCLENPFEPPNDKEVETDAYDDQATHFLLRHKKSGIFVGTARVIKKKPDHRGEFLPPVFRLCKEHDIHLPPDYTPENCLEISRLAISKTFRRRISDTQYPDVYGADELNRDIEKDRARIIPCMTLGLIGAVYRYALTEKVPNCCVVMAATLARLLGKLGIVFDPAGEPIEYHGRRQIFTITVPHFIESVSKLRPEILDIFTDKGRYL